MPLVRLMALEHDKNTALARAIRAVGSQSDFGRLVGRAQSSVHFWLKNDRQLPAELVATVEAAPPVVAAGITRYDLRPDLFIREVTAAAPDLAPRP